MTTNQVSMIGPKARPIFAVPERLQREQRDAVSPTAAGST